MHPVTEPGSPGLAGPFVIEADDPCLDGHFPGNPLVPGVVVLDLAARALDEMCGAPVQIGGITQVKFASPLRPGEPLMIECQVRPRARTASFRCASRGRLIAEGVFVFAVAPEQ